MNKIVSIALAIFATGCEKRSENPSFISIDYENSPKPQFRPDLSEFALVSPHDLEFSYEIFEEEKAFTERDSYTFDVVIKQIAEDMDIDVSPRNYAVCKITVKSKIHDRQWSLSVFESPPDGRTVPLHKELVYGSGIYFADLKIPSVRMYRLMAKDHQWFEFSELERPIVVESAKKFLEICKEKPDGRIREPFSKIISQQVFSRGKAKVWEAEIFRPLDGSGIKIESRKDVMDYHDIQRIKLSSDYNFSPDAEYPNFQILAEPLENPPYGKGDLMKVWVPGERYRQNRGESFTPLDVQIFLLLFDIVEFDKALAETKKDFREHKESANSFGE